MGAYQASCGQGYCVLLRVLRVDKTGDSSLSAPLLNRVLVSEWTLLLAFYEGDILPCIRQDFKSHCLNLCRHRKAGLKENKNDKKGGSRIAIR
jgi:hypothetical protein